jgi:uncharacterized protein
MQQTITLNPLTAQHKNIFDSAYAMLPVPLAEHSFSWLQLWDFVYHDMQWARIHGNLCLFLTVENNRYVWGPPIGGTHLRETIAECFRICDEYNGEHAFTGQAQVTYIPEELLAEYQALPGYRLTYQNQDYIYRAADLLQMPGKAYKDKRNLIKSLLAKHPIRSEVFDSSHAEACLTFLGRWYDMKKDVVPEQDAEKLLYDVKATEKAIRFAEHYGFKGLVVFSGDDVQGFTFGERISPQLCSVTFEKTNPAIKGLAPYIFQQFVKTCWRR